MEVMVYPSTGQTMCLYDHISRKSGISSLHQKLILVCISKHKPHM